MKATALVGLLCAAAGDYVVSSASVSTLYPHVPLVFWSDRPIFNSQNAYLNAVLGETEIASTLTNVLARDTAKDAGVNVLSKEKVTIDETEALCVFLRQNLRTDQIDEFADGKNPSFIQQAVTCKSKSSVVVPHTTRKYTLRKALKDVAKPTFVSINDINEWIASPAGAELLTNNKPDLLVIDVPQSMQLVEADKAIEAAVTALSNAAKGRVDFALTGDEGEPAVVKDPFGRRLASTQNTTSIVCETGYLVGFSGGKAFCFSHYVHMTPHLLTALLFGFFFLFLAYVGLTVLHGIQTPLRYPHHGPPKGKEF
ncbi:hypothetical protein Poli38472_000046 [Pythium oligandrum]|uniref:Protein BIG1 n=1 Tax=Pythium oligandrum TaxID=41045 RepID=A0A8K1CBI2_PYTOL|nr:hypothetical protein Poli38472_000046 [Pythium oligandrum]|eukprot:TMW60004.1 hypothetical protein Poli38472_000046 [Pythium oligandrum]